MTKEEALKSFEEENKDFEKIFERYGYQMSPEEVSAVKEAIERNKIAISALSTEGEHIKKSELLQHVTTEVLSDYKECDVIHAEEIDELTTYSFPNSAENKGDLISRQAVLDELKKWDWQELYLPIHFKQILDDIPSVENKGEWIHVSERLPEKNTRCLVAVGLFNLTQMATYSDLMGTIDHTIFYQGDYGHESFKDITEYVKAWQPLPEPYKGESEE